MRKFSVFEHKGSERALAWVFYGLQKGEIITIGDLNIGDFKLAAFWIHEGTCVGIMLESGDAAQVSALESAVRSGKSVDIDALKSASSVDQALAMVL